MMDKPLAAGMPLTSWDLASSCTAPPQNLEILGALMCMLQAPLSPTFEQFILC